MANGHVKQATLYRLVISDQVCSYGLKAKDLLAMAIWMLIAATSVA